MGCNLTGSEVGFSGSTQLLSVVEKKLVRDSQFGPSYFRFGPSYFRFGDTTSGLVLRSVITISCYDPNGISSMKHRRTY